MNIIFFKYQGTGNDFIILDNRDHKYSSLSTEHINRLCDRKFGIGADGLMMLENHDQYDFEMKYYNSDGKEGSMCGNGGRCLVAFAKKLDIINDKTTFIASDGVHHANISTDNIVSLKMQDINKVDIKDKYYFLDTGSPHYVCFKEDVKDLDINILGSEIRYSKEFKPNGTNVNFVEISENNLNVRTYERGVEDETLSCGTGVTASAICAAIKNTEPYKTYNIKTLGGELKVHLNKVENTFSDIWLEGPAKLVFNVEIFI